MVANPESRSSDVELGLPEITVAGWTPEPDGKGKMEQVHLIIELSELREFPFLMRFKSPDTIGFIIEELARYRREVWPEAEPLTLEDPDFQGDDQ